MSERVLCLARPGDPSVELVARALARRGVELVWPDLRRFPGELSLGFGVGEDALPPRLGGVELAGARSLWIRHLEVGEALPETLSPEHRSACASLGYAAVISLIECLDLFQLDPLEAVEAAPVKARQGQLARRFGLEVPRTLVSNDADTIRAFARRCGGELIAKMLESGSVLLQGADGLEPYPTTLLSADDLESLDGIALSPMIFQERIPRRLEARVTVVGHDVFVAAVEGGEAVDVRTDPSLIAGLRPYVGVPERVRAGLLAMLDHLGLNFGTFDLILTPEGRWVFLEMNTVSFFDHVERNAGLPISESVSELLLGLRPPRVPQRR